MQPILSLWHILSSMWQNMQWCLHVLSPVPFSAGTVPFSFHLHISTCDILCVWCVWVHASQQCVCVLWGVGERGQQGVCACAHMGVLQQSFRWVLETEIMSTQHFQTLSLDDVHLKDFMYFIVTRQPGNSYRKMPVSLLLCLLWCIWHL